MKGAARVSTNFIKREGNRAVLSVIVFSKNAMEAVPALVKNAKWMAEDVTQVVWVSCGKRADHFELPLSIPKPMLLRHAHLSVPRLNRASAINIGVYLSDSPIVMTLQPNVVLSSMVVNRGISLLSDKTFATIDWLSPRPPEQSWLQSYVFGRTEVSFVRSIVKENVLTLRLQDRALKIRTSRYSVIDGARNGDDHIMVSKEHFVRVQGYHSQLGNPEWSDCDLALRLKSVLHLQCFEMGDGLEFIARPRKLAFRTAARPDRETLIRYARGDFLGTYNADVISVRGKVTVIDQFYS